MTVGGKRRTSVARTHQTEDPTIDIMLRLKLDQVVLRLEDYASLQLSGGMKKARSRRPRPRYGSDILFFDEPYDGSIPSSPAGIRRAILEPSSLSHDDSSS